MNIFHLFARKNLWANRTRTAITIVGIILSSAMLTAVTTMASSIRQYGIAYEEAVVGDWHVRASGVREEVFLELCADSRVSDSYALKLAGYAPIPGMESTYKPYFCIQEMDEEFLAHMPLKLIEGRMPEKDGEVLLTYQMLREKGAEIEVGDTLTLPVGRRVDGNGRLLWQTDEYRYTEYEDGRIEIGEQLIGTVERAYTVTGICRRPEFEQYMAPGYALLTVEETDLQTDPDGAADSSQEETAGHADSETEAAEDVTAGRAGSGTDVAEDVTVGHAGSEMEASQEETVGHADSGTDVYYDGYFIMNDPKDALNFYRELDADGTTSDYNYQLLRFYGQSERSDFNNLIYGMGGILIVIIVIGSVALIYNAFAISIGERTKQFGLLNSIGASRRQMLGAVCYEALLLCVIGVPLGIASGICGIGITLSFFRGQFEYLIGSVGGVRMGLYVSVESVLLAALIGVVTVLFSAWLPMRRALKISAIDAIRQRKDIRLTKKSVRTPGWVSRLFGLEGMIAWKNFKRNRKQYRVTVISIAMSILLFVSVGSFSEYVFGSYRSAVQMSPYDISVNVYGENYADAMAIREQVGGLESMELVYECYYLTQEYPMELRDGMLTEEAETLYWESNGGGRISVCFFTDDIFEELAGYYGLDAEEYLDPEHPQAVVFNHLYDWDPDGNPLEYTVLKSGCEAIRCVPEEDADGAEPADETAAGSEAGGRGTAGDTAGGGEAEEHETAGAMAGGSEAEEHETAGAMAGGSEEAERETAAGSEAGGSGTAGAMAGGSEAEEHETAGAMAGGSEAAKPQFVEYRVGAVVDNNPYNPAEFSDRCMVIPGGAYRLRLIYPLSVAGSVPGVATADSGQPDGQTDDDLAATDEGQEGTVRFYGMLYYNTPVHTKVSGELARIADENPDRLGYNDAAESEEQHRALYLMVNVFCYGFIILISLISAANVFHTISTNIGMRRREFAMLSSVGMTPAARGRMLRFECLIYGIKGLGCGYLLAAAATVLMYYLGFGNSFEGFYVAWRYYLIAAVCVFAVVYVTMLYAGRRIRKENLIETLKDDGEG